MRFLVEYLILAISITSAAIALELTANRIFTVSNTCDGITDFDINEMVTETLNMASEANEVSLPFFWGCPFVIFENLVAKID